MRLLNRTFQTPTVRLVIVEIVRGAYRGTDYVRYDCGVYGIKSVSLTFVLAAIADGAWQEVETTS